MTSPASSGASASAGGRVVLITGTSSGIGLATATAAAGAGWTTVATLRDPQRADGLRQAAARAGVVLDIRPLDVTDPGSVTRCIDSIVADHGRLDALVNNAGVGHVGTTEVDDMAAFRECVEVNFFGVVQTTRAALPHLRSSRGRLVTVSSVGGVVGQPFNEAYCAAKFAVEGFSEALAPVLAATGVDVAVIEPGAVASDFVANAGLQPDALIADAGPYADVLERYLARTVQQFGTGAQPAAEVAALIVDVLGMEKPPFRLQTSDWSRGFVARKLADTDGSAVLNMTSAWLTST